MTMELLGYFVLPAAFALDFILGDPRWGFHPVRIMGKAIETAEPRFRALPFNPVVSGALFALTLIGGVFVVSLVFMQRLWAMSPVAGFVAETILVYFCISAKDLKDSVRKIYESLVEKRMEKARGELSMIVGREVDGLDEGAVARACVETTAENLVDGVVAPLFFAALGGAPLALAYKMINTLDSMVGYKNDKYILFGRASAKIDDAANWLPARLSVPIISLAAQILAKKGEAALETAGKDGRSHSSPNAGYPEAAFSGAFSIRLGGPNRYHGKLVDKPYIGRFFGPVGLSHVPKACDLMTLSSLLTLVLFWGAGVMAGLLFP